MNSLVLALDLVGTFVFALAGAPAGVRRQLDILGVAVLSFATACSGGIARDLLIGIREVDDQAWLVSFIDYGSGFFDKEQDRVEPGPNPFLPDKVLTM